MKKRQIIIVVSAFAIFIGSFALSGWLSDQKEEPEKVEPKEVKKYVKTEKVEYKNVLTQVVAYGRIRSDEELDAIPEVSGRMFKGTVRLKPGQSFKKGDILVRIDDREAKFKLQSQISSFIKDLAAIAPDVKIDFPDRYDAWYAYFKSVELDKPIPELPHYSTDKEKTFLATKNIYSSYFNIKSQEVNLKKYKIYAPFSGSITEVFIQTGSYVSPGNKIARIVRTDRLEMIVDVPLSDIEWVYEGQEVDIATEDRQKEWRGRVARIGDVVNPQTQSIDVYLDVSTSGERVYGGQYLRTIIPGRIIENAMEVPRNILVNTNQVYVVEDSLLKIKDINIFKVNAETFVFNGIDEDSDLVMEPLINAANNMKVYKLSDKGSDIDIESKTDSKVATAAIE